MCVIFSEKKKFLFVKVRFNFSLLRGRPLLKSKRWSFYCWSKNETVCENVNKVKGMKLNRNCFYKKLVLKHFIRLKPSKLLKTKLLLIFC